MLLRHARSLLFLPASNPRAIAKARTLPCDMVILDLEDAVADDRKAEALDQALEALAARRFARFDEALEDIARTVVGLDVINRAVGDNTIVIRGVNADGESGATILWDNMPTSGSGEDTSDLGRRQFDLDVYDVEQVEVLRGPRGTLLGSNSLAGAVRFVTRKPDLEAFDAGFTTQERFGNAEVSVGFNVILLGKEILGPDAGNDKATVKL